MMRVGGGHHDGGHPGGGMMRGRGGMLVAVAVALMGQWL